jgi:uncharacterized protein YqiB (DUF1249 family)
MKIAFVIGRAPSGATLALLCPSAIVGVMRNETLTLVSWRARPRSFVALMSLYESNYIRLGRLAGMLGALAGTYRSQVEGDCDLLLTVVERCVYTSILDLTYELLDGKEPQRTPQMRLRVYHDARLVEAERCPGSIAEVTLQDGRCPERELHRRWTRNMMLNKWLEYCAERGHRFATPIM